MIWTTTSHFNPALVEGAVKPAPPPIRQASTAPAVGGIEAMSLDPLEMLFLEDNVKASNIPMPHFLVRFGIARITQLPPSKFIEARDWIIANSTTKGLT